ncbi:MAG TPA: hypothetical protein VEF76_08505 [Patescibacteria group bacterium]|nr:hypothetical protein [Patescibacteria group bacterium]
MKYRMASYELYALAVAAFIVDHVGLYMYDDNLWFRVFRMFALVWFIPAGYNAGRKTDLWMWQCAILLAVAGAITGFGVFPLSAVATIIFTRYVIDPLAEWSLGSRFRFWVLNIGFILVMKQTDEIMEYGTIALMIALAGWLLKNRDRAAGIVDLRLYFGFVTTIFLLFTAHTFPFNPVQWAIVVSTTAATAVLMYHFRALLLETIRRRKADAVSRACRWIGHNTLQLYTAQLLLLQGMYYF